MMRFNKINFGLLMLLFLCRFENILGTSDKNIEEGLKEKYKIVDLKGTTLKNEQGEDFSFIVTCKYDGICYKWFKGIESDIENIKKEESYSKQLNMGEGLKKKSGACFVGDIVKTNDGKVLVVKDNEIEDKVYLVLGKYDEENSKTANIFLDKNFNLQTAGPYNIIYDIIEENKTASVVIGTGKECGGKLFKGSNAYKFQFVCCKLEKEDNFDENSGCCGRLCNWCKNLCP